MINFSAQDLQQFQDKGITVEVVHKQLDYFKTGFPFVAITKAATVGAGILQLSAEQQAYFVKLYEAESPNRRISKFVPASGAASRMFKALFAFVAAATDVSEQAALLNEEKHRLVKPVIDDLTKFAFFANLKAAVEKYGKSVEALLAAKDYASLLEYLLTDKGLNYGSLPKGLLEFHQYEGATRTPVEEHLVEGAVYAKNADGSVHLHFTVSPEHQARFEEEVTTKKAAFENLYQVKYQVEFSQQHPYTDTIAVDLNNEPFRLEDGKILFRPGGHGALIENLNALEADVVFIKNIDNVVPDKIKADTFHFKKIIGGVLIDTQRKIFDYLEKLDAVESPALVEAIETFYQKDLSTTLPESYHTSSFAEKMNFLRSKLNRPIRVCGMVKNEGEPGGGPFLVVNPDGSSSLQIVESAQINTEDPSQKDLMRTASHFNPVDIVCSLKNYKGEKFNLLDFVDHNQGFIASKSKSGRDLKALELPGLWNGSQADYNTIFVEVPISTFNPVKRVNDLLRETHQV